MSEYDRKYEAAITELSETGIWPSNYKPPVLRLLRAMKVAARPPHYASFWSVVVGYCLWFAPAWGLMMWFAAWSGEMFPPLVAIGAALFAGVLFGFAMAIYYAKGRRKWKLSRWDDL